MDLTIDIALWQPPNLPFPDLQREVHYICGKVSCGQGRCGSGEGAAAVATVLQSEVAQYVTLLPPASLRDRSKRGGDFTVAAAVAETDLAPLR